MADPASVNQRILKALHRIEEKLDRVLLLLGDAAIASSDVSETDLSAVTPSGEQTSPEEPAA